MSQTAHKLVAAILNNEDMINTLANACQNPPNTPAHYPVRTSEEEVCSIFNRGRPTTGQAAAYRANLSMPSTSQECPNTAPVYNLRPYTRKGPRHKRFQAQGSSRSVAQSFFKEVILLPDHKVTHVPRRAKKAWLFENGHIRSVLEFGCDWDSDRVMEAIKTAFQPAVEGCSHTPSMSSGDEVIWCFDAPSIPADTLNMSTFAGVITIDETPAMSSGTPAISTGNTHGLSVGPTVNASGKRHGIFADRTSGVSHGPTQPSASGNSSSSTSYSTYLDLFEEEYLSDDPDLQEAISRSLDSNTSESDLQITLERIMDQLSSRVNNDSTVRFNIIRRSVWDGASRALGRSNFSPEKKVDVKFTDDCGISEGAVDNGGPTREFFRLCLLEIKDKIGIFEGPPDAKVLTCNSKGPDNVKVKTEHITDEETRSQVQSILQAENESHLQDAVAQASTLISLAGHNVRITLQNKAETALDLTHWYVLQRTRAPFERFRDGLMSLGVLDAIQRYPQQMKCLFLKAEKSLTAADVENLFRIIHSERGSNAFQEECRTLAFWQDYLQDAECENGVSLQDILVFLTGCDSVPALGFSPKPSLEFITHSRFPQANTCANILRIPVHAEYTAFKCDMTFAIRNSPGFGRA
ncbi:G2/M phase-specific E3 ubiquitin-protein ligase [Collichthys lucidus]|uniref:HECT-type E3 ubiquitin transferase n=1 Tax=Collichthys lucidus TaxID=240159 RepID=A0A4U5TWF8_COLLU|nr:G2/M phase-specific E3 ubiquitin-protein ligase [Collichthys lucidus]